MTAPSEVRETVAAALHPAIASSVTEGTADLTAHPVPGLPEGTVWRVTLTGTDHPLQTYVGVGPGGTGHVLPDHQAAFADLVAAVGGARIGDPDTALGYLLGYLEVTRGPTVIVQPVGDAGELRWRPGTADEEARRAAFLSGPPIAPPTARPTATGFQVVLWLVVDQRVQRNRFDVTADGGITADFQVVADDLPLPVAR